MGFTPLLSCAILLAAGVICLRMGGGALRRQLFHPPKPLVTEVFVPDPGYPSEFRKVTRVQEPDGPGRGLILFGAGVLLTLIGFRARDGALIPRAEPYEGSWSDRRRKAEEGRAENREKSNRAQPTQ